VLSRGAPAHPIGRPDPRTAVKLVEHFHVSSHLHAAGVARCEIGKYVLSSGPEPFRAP